ncbi:MAG: DNA translocase FtsK 4TM domain-containing protein [Planctomycetes bacterium]|nr:DNA translocase FtsK 4TM domain-containing protein [Planctomycetota bacterium]
MLTYSPLDWPNTAVWPQIEPVQNACGRAGAWFSFQFMYYLGVGSYPLFFMLTVAAAMQLMRRRMRDIALRCTGLMMIVCITSAAAALMEPTPTEGLVEGKGGIVGIALAEFLRTNLQTFGALLVVATVYIVGFLLAADEVLVLLPRLVRWMRGRILEAVAAFRAPVRFVAR